MKNSKIYNSFTDKFNNVYNFNTYLEFAQFWFNMSTKTAKLYFPNNFKELQKYACDSIEARTKIA